MKNYYFGFLALVMCLFPKLIIAQLNPGDIAFIGVNTNSGAGTNDNFTFIVLTDVSGGEEIYFTDEGWNLTANNWAGSGETHLLYTAPVAGLNCGTVVSINKTGASITATIGAVEEQVPVSGGASWELSGGDQILAYQALNAKPTSSFTFIAGLQFDDGQNMFGNRLDVNTKWSEVSAVYPFWTPHSNVPIGLTNGVNCVSVFPTAGTEQGNAVYTGTLVGVSADILTSINDSSNWNSQDSFPFDISFAGVTKNIHCGPLTNPDVPTVTASNNAPCVGETIALNITGNLNDAAHWSVYTASCGGTLIGTTTSGSFSINAASTNTYFIRGEGGFVTPNMCASIAITLTPSEDASFSYSATTYCADDTNPSPTITGTLGGSFSSSPAGLDIHSGTGAIDLSASVPNTYTITYTTAGICSASNSVDITINPLDNASFSYNHASYCVNTSDPTPSITGVGGGSFSAAPAGLVIDTSTGDIDVSASIPNNYTITYTTSGTCANSTNSNVTILPLDDASFAYSAASFCILDSDPTPSITGVTGGTFTANNAGLSIDAITGVIDLSNSTVGNYMVTYTSTGACVNSSNVALEIRPLVNANFNYSNTTFCVNGSNEIPTITGLTGGLFSASPLGLTIDSVSGVITTSSSVPGNYTVTYTVGDCTNSSSQNITIEALEDASFSYSRTNYCINATNPVPSVSGEIGGVFSGSTGLVIDSVSGEIDIANSGAGSYVVTYTTVGSCANKAQNSIVIKEIESASISYTAATYVLTDENPIPSITGVLGGVFSANGGMQIHPTTGEIDLANTTVGSYVVQYTTPGLCAGTTSFSIDIVADNSPPVVVRFELIGNPNARESSVSYLLTFDEEINGGGIADFKLKFTGSVLAEIQQVVVSGNTLTIKLEDIEGEGSLQLELKEQNGITDVFGNGNGVPGYVRNDIESDSHTVDRIAPELEFVRTEEAVVSKSSFKLHIESSEWVSGLEVEDFQISNGTITNLEEETSGYVFSLAIQASNDGDVDVTLPGDTVEDVVGNPNLEEIAISTKFKRIASEDELKKLPNTLITPNADGKNDYWVIKNIEEYPNNNVRVFNKAGQTVFEASGYLNEWNGRYQNGTKELPVGLYYYYIRFKPELAPVSGTLYIMH